MGGQLWLQGMYLKKRTRAYMQLFNTLLLQEVRKNPNNIYKGNVDSGPLTEKDVYPKA